MTVSAIERRKGSGGFIWMPYVTIGAAMAALYLVFFFAPVEREMGGVQRIFYFHVGSAIFCLLCFVVCAIASGSYLFLAKRSGHSPYLAARADRLAYAFGEIGVLLGVIVLVTGPIWAKPAWNAWWTWEPRLMLLLLTVFLFVGYLVLRRQAGGDPSGRRLAAGIAVIGAPAAYFIHVAVDLWGGNHPTVIYEEDGLAPDMKTAFLVSVLAVGLLTCYLVYVRYRHHTLRDQTEDLFLHISELEDAAQ